MSQAPAFFDLVDQYRMNEASIDRLFGDVVGKRRAKPTRAHQKKLATTLRFIEALQNGDMSQTQFKEAMTTSDFPVLMGDLMDRQLLGAYRAAPATWPAYMKRETVRDFRTVERVYYEGLTSTLEKVAEQQEYPEKELTDGSYEYRVFKYGRRVALSWEAMINDDLQAFTQIPTLLGASARRTEERFATELFVGASGPNAGVYSGGNGNVITGNPALSIASLQAAMTQISKFKDSDGQPITIESMVLVIPPALEITAMNIINATQIEVTESGGTGAQKVITGNWIKGRLKVVVNPYIPVVAATANGDTSWFLFADPNASRPAFVVGFLRGHEDPQIFWKSPNAMRSTSSLASPLDGDFDTDSIEYKVRHVLGGTKMDPKATVASNGSGA